MKGHRKRLDALQAKTQAGRLAERHSVVVVTSDEMAAIREGTLPQRVIDSGTETVLFLPDNGR